MSSPPRSLLFFCARDAARGPMAAALARALFGDAVRARSAGARPAPLSALAAQVLAEIGVEVGPGGEGIDALEAASFELVIRLCGDAPLPATLAGVPGRVWAVPDPLLGGTAAEELLHCRAARDQLHARLLALGRELGLSPGGLRPRGGPPLVAVVGWKNSGKTTLVERLVAALTARGRRVATVKATHHDVDPDPPGKDSWRHRRAGAVETLLVGPRRWVLTREGGGDLAAGLARLGPADLVVIEGLRGASLPKVEVIAPDSERPVLARTDPDVFLVASDRALAGVEVTVLPRDSVEAIADRLEEHLGLAGIE
jgi:molybdopterin-guanine dinucleotide biosynthesis protein B